ncbi:MAG: enoyl-ACP reductase FabI [Nitrococcus mobilis]|nr:enoyl-ACP reductase FabI [Nitrococcus mobilis]
MIANLSLAGKKGLIAGIANEHSIAYGCARICHQAGAELVLTYGHPKAEPHVRPLAPGLGDPELWLLDVRDDGQLQAVFDRIRDHWGRLDFLIHSIAFAPKDDLHGRLVDCSREGFAVAMDISCHSFIRMAKLAEPLMPDGGCLLTMSYYGAVKVVEHYNLMGPVKAALECAVRYMAAELGSKGIRVHAVSPGPLETRAASGIKHFDALLNEVATRAPVRDRVDIDDVGRIAACLVSDGARRMTGHTVFVDAGYHILG